MDITVGWTPDKDVNGMKRWLKTFHYQTEKTQRSRSSFAANSVSILNILYIYILSAQKHFMQLTVLLEFRKLVIVLFHFVMLKTFIFI